jgi:hypothetical protein
MVVYNKIIVRDLEMNDLVVVQEKFEMKKLAKKEKMLLYQNIFILLVIVRNKPL